MDAFSASCKEKGSARVLICRLDSKHRLVLPVLVREKLGLNGSVQLRLEGDRVIIKKPERTLGALPISRNCSEVIE